MFNPIAADVAARPLVLPQRYTNGAAGGAKAAVQAECSIGVLLVSFGGSCIRKWRAGGSAAKYCEGGGEPDRNQGSKGGTAEGVWTGDVPGLESTTFADPNASLGNPDFGKSRTTLSTPRQLQFALRITF